MDLINETVEHPVFGTGKVIHHDAKRITIQFAKEIGIKLFVYPDAFDKYLKMCNPAAAQEVRTDLISKKQLIAEQQRKEDELG